MLPPPRHRGPSAAARAQPPPRPPPPPATHPRGARGACTTAANDPNGAGTRSDKNKKKNGQEQAPRVGAPWRGHPDHAAREATAVGRHDTQGPPCVVAAVGVKAGFLLDTGRGAGARQPARGSSTAAGTAPPRGRTGDPRSAVTSSPSPQGAASTRCRRPAEPAVLGPSPQPPRTHTTPPPSYPPLPPTPPPHPAPPPPLTSTS